MDYLELHARVAPGDLAEIATTELSELPFEGFTIEEDGFRGYLPADMASFRDAADEILRRCGIAGAEWSEVGDRNWNAEWESGFEPVDIDGRLLIRAPFHAAAEGRPEIVIMPDMSFGTGHHATTRMMVGLILDTGAAGRRVLDVGCGTGILSIAAALSGASEVDAVDIDPRSCDNCRSNAAMNGAEGRIRVLCGDVSAVTGRRYGMILANINRNILQHDMPSYAAALERGGALFVSGFYDTDADAVTRAAAASGLAPCGGRHLDGWAALAFAAAPGQRE